ncbi:nucleotide disphospho-sugar-binding domain-containing protein [Streptomyces sp. NPDC020742]|uniref:nucleotide disphospho-sugar-binding domain-containing protein n=1 Tax=Streptomyces sp. NPDC020742 TaxID=3154897 RepID=UPI0033DF6E1C
MRVLAATWDLPGHFNPLVPLCWALRAAGHEVTVVSNPGLAPAISRSGLPALAAGRPDFDSYAVLRERLAQRKWKPTQPVDRADHDQVERTRRRRLNGLRIATDSAAAQADDALAFARSWRPDLVLYEPAGFLGPLVARLLGVPAVRLLWSVDFTASLAEFEADVVGDLAERYGLDTLGVNGDLTLDPCPPALQYPYELARQRFRYVPYNGPSVVPAWANERPDRPRVCVTWGTSQHRLGFDDMVLAPRVVEALADVDVDVVVAVLDSQREAFGTPPPNVSWIGQVPLHPLLGTCDVLVQQGGAGGTMTGLIHGVPQLVVPQLPDELFHGQQMEKGGGGLTLPGADATVEALRAHVVKLLEAPSYRQRAGELRADMLAQPSPAEIVDILQERLT